MKKNLIKLFNPKQSANNERVAMKVEVADWQLEMMARKDYF